MMLSRLAAASGYFRTHSRRNGMRGLVTCVCTALAFALLTFVVAVPSAQAQGLDMATLTVDDFATRVTPLEGQIVTNFTVVVHCALVDFPGTALTYSIERQPAWSEVVVSPALDLIEPADCLGTTTTRHGTLTVGATDAAPAFRPEPIALRLDAGSGERKATATDTVDLTAAWFSRLDFTVTESIKMALPDEQVVYEVRVTNGGNGPLRVAFESGGAAQSLKVTLPDPITLQSRQTDGPDAAVEAIVRILVQTPDATGWTNEPASIVVRATSHHADDASLAGDSGQISMLVMTKGFALGSAKTSSIPNASHGVVLGAFALLAVAPRVR
jgi:hypothetical protein